MSISHSTTHTQISADQSRAGAVDDIETVLTASALSVTRLWAWLDDVTDRCPINNMLARLLDAAVPCCCYCMAVGRQSTGVDWSFQAAILPGMNTAGENASHNYNIVAILLLIAI